MRRLVLSVATTALLVACSGGHATVPATEAPATVNLDATSAPTPTTAGVTTGTQADTAPPGTFASFDPPPDGRNWMQVSARGGASLNEEPELCLILDEGKTGKIEAFNLALTWAEGEWTLTWLNAGGTYQGPVAGTVDGLTVSFEGEVDGMAVAGSVTCLEP